MVSADLLTLQSTKGTIDVVLLVNRNAKDVYPVRPETHNEALKRIGRDGSKVLNWQPYYLTIFN